MAEIRENGCFRVLTSRNKALPLQRCPVNLGLFCCIIFLSDVLCNQICFGVLFFSGRVDGKAVYLCCCYFAVLAACMVYGFEGQLKRNRSVISKMFSPSFHSQLPHSHQAYYTGYKYLMASFQCRVKPPQASQLQSFVRLSTKYCLSQECNLLSTLNVQSCLISPSFFPLPHPMSNDPL